MKNTLYRTMITAAACLLSVAISNVAEAFPGRSGACNDCHNDGSGNLDPSPDPITILAGDRGLLTFDVTALPDPNGNNMIALEDLSIPELDASIGPGGDNWTLGTTATKSDQGIGLGAYTLDLMIGPDAILGSYELNWRLVGEGPSGTSGLFHIMLVSANTGDYNDDGVVNAADYVVWRNHNGQDVTLPNDSTPGTVRDEDYDVWVENFGMVGSNGSGSISGSAVPEPATWPLLAMVSLLFHGGRRKV